MSESGVPLRRLGFLAFAAATVPFAVGGHLLSEMAALGGRNPGAVVFTPRHLYFIAVGLAALAALRFISRSLSGPGRAARVEALLQALPCGGRGARFAALTFAVQVGFFGITQFAEGCPVWGGDVVAGLLTALLAAAVASLLLAFFERRFVSFALLIAWVSAQPRTPAFARSGRAPVARFAGRRGAFLSSLANRPPPVAAVV